MQSTQNSMALNQDNPILTKDYDTLVRLGQHQGDSYIGRGAKQRNFAKPKDLPELIGAIDQGTSSTRFLVFENQTGHLIASSQMEIKRVTPKEGWVEIDPISIMTSVHATKANVYEQLIAHYNLPAAYLEQPMVNLLSCIGICNQRESAVVWDSQTGQPFYNVIVWMDNRTKYIVDEMIDSTPGRDFNRFKDKTGLPMSTYFSAFKLKWLMDNVADVKQAMAEKRLLFGTVDSWILWNLTGGKHMTDVTNASRTFLMDIETLQWDKSLCKHFKVPLAILPEIRASADNYGQVQVGPFKGTPITGVIGDQSAALFGHNCLQMGQTKATFGTGCFIMQNIGPGPLNGAISGVNRDAKKGLITTVGYKLGDRPACYALEGSIKIAGAALTWLRDNIQLIQNYEECDILVNKTTHSAGVFFVPALGGLYSPYWDPNAAGMFIGLSQFTRREHLVRATFDSIAFQTNDILSLMRGVASGLMIDGGLCKSDNLCQILADITGYDIIRPSMCETSALGAAMVAGYGAGLWSYEGLLTHSNEPLDASLNYSNHYPHESLSKEYNPLPGPSNCGSRSRTKSMTSNEAAARHRRNSFKQNRAALIASNQQHHRQHLRSANGVNDDAGGGREGDRGGGLQKQESEDHDDAGSATSSGRLAVSSITTNTTEFAPSTSDNSNLSPLESSMESNGKNNLGLKPDGMLAPLSSGYSSGDNIEQATSLSGTSLRGRVDSPSSQVTDNMATQSDTQWMAINGRDVVTGVDIATTGSPNPNLDDCARSSSTDGYEEDKRNNQAMDRGQKFDTHHNTGSFPYSLKNFFAKQSRVLETTTAAMDEMQRYSDNEIEDQEEDLVHEFGGRDSYGEDGYNSSSESFDSYVSKDDEDLQADSEKPLSFVGTTEDDLDNEVAKVNPDQQDSEQQTVSLTGSNKHRVSRRQYKSSVLAKHMDVFQSYISLDHRTDLVETWRRAVERSMQWTKVHHEEVKRIDYQRLSSLPISIYLFFSIGMVALSAIKSIN